MLTSNSEVSQWNSKPSRFMGRLKQSKRQESWRKWHKGDGKSGSALLWEADT